MSNVSSTKLKMGYEVGGYAIDGSSVGSTQSLASLGKSGPSISSFKEINASLKPYAPFLLLNNKSKANISIVGDQFHKNTETGCQLIGNECLPLDYDKLKNKNAVKNENGDFYCGCSLSKSLLKDYCIRYYPKYSDLYDNLIILIQNKKLYCNVKFQVGEQNSESLQFLVTDVCDNANDVGFIGINAAAILAQTENLIEVVITDGKGKNFQLDGKGYSFKWKNYKNGIIDDYNSSIVDKYSSFIPEGFVAYIYKNKKNNNSDNVNIRPFLQTKDASEVEKILVNKTYPSGQDELYDYNSSNVFVKPYSSVLLNGGRPPACSQQEIRKETTVYGKCYDESNMALVTSPYPLIGNERYIINGKQFKAHKLVAPYIEKILQEVLEHYGLEEIKKLKLNVLNSGFRHTKVDGSNNWSIHCWGLAFDWAYNDNRFAWNREKALFGGSEYNFWWDTWEKYGGMSLGRWINKDWMHVQFSSEANYFSQAAKHRGIVNKHGSTRI